MTYEEAINLLNHAINSLNRRGTNFEAWLDNTIETIAEIFGTGSTEQKHFIDFRREYKIGMISKLDADLPGKSITRGTQQLEGLIKKLERWQADAIEKAVREEQQASHEPEDGTYLHEPVQTEIKSIEMNEPKEKNSYAIGVGIFWTVLPLIVAGAFTFGLYVGTTKFDKDKNDLVDTVRDQKEQIGKLKEEMSNSRDSTSIFMQQSKDWKADASKLYQVLPDKIRDSVKLANPF